MNKTVVSCKARVILREAHRPKDLVRTINSHGKRVRLEPRFLKSDGSFRNNSSSKFRSKHIAPELSRRR